MNVEQLVEAWGGVAITAFAVLIVIAVAGGLIARVLRYQSLRALARGQGWRWLGRSERFGRLVASAFPEMVDAAKRSARRSARRTANGSSQRGDLARQAAGLALDLSGAGTRTDARVRGRCVAVAPTSVGEATVGEARISVRTSTRGIPRQGGRRSATSSASCTAAVARLPASVPPVRLVRRRLITRLLGGADESLPEEMTRRFDVQELPEPARAALVDTGAYRALLERPVKVEGLTIADGHVAVMTRRRLSRGRARGLVHVLEQLVTALPSDAWTEPLDRVELQAPVTD